MTRQGYKLTDTPTELKVNIIMQSVRGAIPLQVTLTKMSWRTIKRYSCSVPNGGACFLLASIGCLMTLPAGRGFFYLIQLGKTSGLVRLRSSRTKPLEDKQGNSKKIVYLRLFFNARYLQRSINTVYFKGQFKGENYDLGSFNQRIRQS